MHHLFSFDMSFEKVKEVWGYIPISQLIRKGRARPSHDCRRMFSTTWLKMELLDSGLRPLWGLTGTAHLTNMLSRYIPGRRSLRASLPVGFGTKL